MKRSPPVQTMLANHTKQYGWIIEYMICRNEGKMITNSVVFKRKAANTSLQADTYSSSSASVMTSPSMSPLAVPREAWERYLTIARFMMTGKKCTGYEYDSDDDPESIVGRRVTFRWKDGNWWPGSIKAYNEKHDTHHIVYDDGDERQYKLFEKNFKLM